MGTRWQRHVIAFPGRYRTSLAMLLSASCVSVFGVSAAHALEDDKAARVRPLEEVIVTAQKRAENLQKVPISISVLGTELLDKSTVEGITEALSQVPGTAVNVTYQGGGTQVVMRGVTAAGALFNGSSPISYYLDSVPFGLVKSAVAPDSNAYDLERVEVLRGPQGTLYGASAQNGVVRVLTKDANVNTFELKARTLLSTTETGGENYRGDLAVNVPLVDGKLAARAVFGYQDLSGWIDRPNRSDANDAQIRNMRLKINAEPVDNLSIGLSAWLSRADYGGPSIADDEDHHAAILDEPIDTDYDAYGAKLRYDFGAASVTSMTSYLEYSNNGYLDLSPLAAILGRDITTLESEVFAQEIVLNSGDDGSWRWSLGGMYRDGEDRLFQDSFSYVTPTDVTNTSESFAVFGELTRILLDGRIELTGGLRYFEDDVSAREDSRLTGAPPSELIRTKSTFDAVSPRVVLTWHPSADLMIYASYAEGFRSGFDQDPSVIATAPTFAPADADTLRNYEVGAKGTFAEGRLTLDAAAYYIDWQDVQQSLTVPVTSTTFTTAIVNGQSASGTGFDLGLTARPVYGLELGVSASWNNLEMDADVFSSGVLLFAKGDRLNLSPELTLGASAGYTFSLGRSGFDGRLVASVSHTSELDLRSIVFGQQTIADGDDMTIGRVSASVEAPEDNWAVSLFVDNVANEHDTPVRFPFAAIIPDWNSRVRPRTIGVQLDFHF
jgi:iron complex outermembrane recepter protein